MGQNLLPGETRTDRGTCINFGCNSPVADAGGKAKTAYRSVCSRCHKAGHGTGQLKEGVVSYRTGICENYRSGILKFECPVEFTSDVIMAKITDIHHINEIHSDNRVENIAELCKICHAMEHRRLKK